MEAGSKTRIKAIGRVMVPSRDPDKAIEFYTENLGFEKLVDIPFGDGLRWVEVALPGAQTTLALVPPREGDPVGVNVPVALDTDDIDASVAKVRELGGTADDKQAVPAQGWFSACTDTEGNKFSLWQADTSAMPEQTGAAAGART